MRRTTIRKLTCVGLMLGFVGIGATYKDVFNAIPKNDAYKNAVSAQKEACLSAFKKGVLLEDCKAFTTSQDKKESKQAKGAATSSVVSSDPEVSSAVIKRKAAAQEYFAAATNTLVTVIASAFLLLISYKSFFMVTTLQDTVEFLSSIGSKMSNLTRLFRKNPTEQGKQE